MSSVMLRRAPSLGVSKESHAQDLLQRQGKASTGQKEQQRPNDIMIGTSTFDGSLVSTFDAKASHAESSGETPSARSLPPGLLRAKKFVQQAANEPAIMHDDHGANKSWDIHHRAGSKGDGEGADDKPEDVNGSSSDDGDHEDDDDGDDARDLKINCRTTGNESIKDAPSLAHQSGVGDHLSSLSVKGSSVHDAPYHHEYDSTNCSTPCAEDQHQDVKQSEQMPSSKRERRLARNRHTARERRKRKALLTLQLEHTVRFLTTQNNELRRKNKRLKEDLRRFGECIDDANSQIVAPALQAPALEGGGENENGFADTSDEINPSPPTAIRHRLGSNDARVIPERVASSDAEGDKESEPPERDGANEDESVSQNPESEAKSSSQLPLVASFAGHNADNEVKQVSTCPIDNKSVAASGTTLVPFLGGALPTRSQLLLQSLLLSTEEKKRALVDAALPCHLFSTSQEVASVGTPCQVGRQFDATAGPASRLLGEMVSMQQRLENQHHHHETHTEIGSKFATQGDNVDNVDLLRPILGVPLLRHQEGHSFQGENGEAMARSLGSLSWLCNSSEAADISLMPGRSTSDSSAALLTSLADAGGALLLGLGGCSGMAAKNNSLLGGSRWFSR